MTGVYAWCAIVGLCLTVAVPIVVIVTYLDPEYIGKWGLWRVLFVVVLGLLASLGLSALASWGLYGMNHAGVSL